MKSRFSLKTWMVILLMLGIIFGKGILAYLVVGDRGVPSWDYGAVQDVPGESIYAVYPALPYPQHIRGNNGE
ncbi:MAG: hypothetical protein AB1659_00545 [Thermodesulfobacteriota bacterium]